jgi:hypothetical protein
MRRGADLTKFEGAMLAKRVFAGGELISALMEKGPVTTKQAHLLVMAAVRAKVSNVEEFEVRERAALIVRGGGEHEHSSAG